jgi:hypothetical protein
MTKVGNLEIDLGGYFRLSFRNGMVGFLLEKYNRSNGYDDLSLQMFMLFSRISKISLFF